MSTELTSLDYPITPSRRSRPLPFVVRHLAIRKPNRLPASIRIPVTPANRALLRELRAEELAAWERSFGAGRRAASHLGEEAL